MKPSLKLVSSYFPVSTVYIHLTGIINRRAIREEEKQNLDRREKKKEKQA